MRAICSHSTSPNVQQERRLPRLKLSGSLNETRFLCRDATMRASETKAPISKAGIALVRSPIWHDEEELENFLRSNLKKIQLVLAKHFRWRSHDPSSFEQVEDAVNDAIAWAWAHQDRYEGERAAVSTWLVGVASNMLRAIVSRRRSVPTLPIEFDPQDEDLNEELEEQQVPETPKRKALRTVLPQLSPKERAIIDAYMNEDPPPDPEALAKRLNTAVDVIYTLKSRAFQKIRAAFAQPSDDHL